MKPKIRLKSPFWTFLFIALFWGCERDYLTEFPDVSTAPTSSLEEARAWFSARGPHGDVWLHLQTRSGGGLLFYSEPSWDYYCETETSRYSAIDVAMTDRIGLDFVPRENLEYFRTTGNYNYRRSFTRLVILTDKKNGKKTGFLMTFIPSAEYAGKHLGRLNRTTYLQRDELLDGLVLFHNLDGSFSNGWQYTRGMITGCIPELLPALDAPVPDTGAIKYVTCELMPCSYRVIATRAGATDTTGVAVPLDTTSSSQESTTIQDTTASPAVDGGLLPEVEVWPTTDEHTVDYGGEVTFPILLGNGNHNSGGESFPGIYIGGNGEKNTPKTTKYTPKDGDKFARKNLPQTMDKQVQNTCVTSIMEYIDNKVFNGSRNEGEFILYYYEKYRENVVTEGVGLKRINDLVEHFFRTKEFVSYKDAIDNKKVVMTDVPSTISNSSHNCVIIGYQSDGKYIYMDPEKGELYVADESYFLENYKIVIAGIKYIL